MAHQAGPSSLKLAALSAYSYHLDSPPFTGTAGPLGDNADDYDRLNSSLRDNATILADEDINLDVSGENTPAAISRVAGANRERVPTNGSGRQVQNKQGMHEGLQEREEIYDRHHSSDHHQMNDNGDVPSWHLEGKTPPHRQHTLDQRSLASDESSGHFLSNSLSPPPFSSDAVGPLGVGQPLEKNNHQRREMPGRPAFAQVNSTTLSNEDASSSGATDADADVDADEEEEPHDTEADGNETAVIPKGTTNGFASKVPTQSQTKVRR